MGTGFELGTDGPLVIVAAADGSPSSMRALAYAGGMARRQHSRLAVVHVSGPQALAGLGGGMAAGEALSAQQELAGDLQAVVDRESARLGLDVVTAWRRGDPFTEISRACEELRADAVVVGASAGAGHRLIGSIAVRLVRAGRWPVTVVP